MPSRPFDLVWGLYVGTDVCYAFFVLGGSLDALPLNLFQVASAGFHLTNWHLISTYVLVMSLPLLVAFVVAQRKIIAGITSGAVKRSETTCVN